MLLTTTWSLSHVRNLACLYGYGTIIAKDPPNFDNMPSGDKFLEKPTIEKEETDFLNATQSVPNDWRQSMQLAKHDLYIWFAGSVTYIDVFDTITTRKFVWVYEHPMRRLVPYDAETTRHQKRSQHHG